MKKYIDYKSIVEKLEHKINLLLIDDDEELIDSMIDLIESPLYSIHTAGNTVQAMEKINKKNQTWHCWVLDIAMEEEDSGLKILQKTQHFPYVLVLSGLGSMNTASRAAKLGAAKICDKDPSLLQQLVKDLAHISSLGTLLRGQPTKYFSTFNLLATHQIRSPEEWAAKANITLRQLRRICHMHVPLSPGTIIPFFYCVRFLLERSDEQIDTFFSDEQNEKDGQDAEFIKSNFTLMEKYFANYSTWFAETDTYCIQ